MAFTIANWTCASPSLNQGQETLTPFGGSPTVENAPNWFLYGSPNDTAATIEASNYFLPQYASLSVGDFIMGFGTDTSFLLQVTASSSTTVTTQTVGFASSVGTANIINNAVTYAKFQQASAHTLIGNPTGSTANVSEITLGNDLSFNGTTLQVSPLLLNYTEVSMTAAQWNGMYAAPYLLVAAPGANNLIVVDSMLLEMTFVSADYAAGGVVAAQYDSTVHGAGVLATNSEAAADFFAAASTSFRFQGAFGNTVGALPFSTTVNKGLYLSNATGAFTTGDSTWTVKVWYKIVPTNS
jgi:hypothetical protein